MQEISQARQKEDAPVFLKTIARLQTNFSPNLVENQKEELKTQYTKHQHSTGAGTKQFQLGEKWHTHEMPKQEEYIAQGHKIKNQIVNNYLHAIKAEIEATRWKTNYSGGVLIEGLNMNQPVPDTVANIYQHILAILDEKRSVLQSKKPYWQIVMAEFQPHLDTTKKKAKEWNFFWKRDKETITFYENFNKEFANLRNMLDEVDAKLSKPERRHNPS